jgi:glycosyltransferase involved in cell wall biosynthesis
MDFVIIGMGEELLSNFVSKPDNLKIIPPVSQSELYGWFGKAKYYAQFSRSEGMPNALCEAMLMECIPLGTSIGGIPGVIQDGGMILDQWDPASAKSFLLEHLDDEILRKKARESIISRFHLEKRAQYLKELLTSA